MTPSGLDEIHCQMKALLIEQDKEATVDHIYACTSTKDMHDPRMKPGARMLLEAIEDANVSPQDCVLIGDTVSDLEAAASACISRRILVSTGYGHSIIGRPPRPPSAMDESDGVLCKLIENITAQHLDNIVSPQLQLAPTSIFPFDYALDLDKAVSYIVGGQK
jgi:histidinol phosphatase-like enzyme